MWSQVESAFRHFNDRPEELVPWEFSKESMRFPQTKNLARYRYGSYTCDYIRRAQ